MAREAQPYPSLPLLQSALAATLARVRASAYIGSSAPGGPCIMRICDDEYRLDAVIVIGEPDNPEASLWLCDAVEAALTGLLTEATVHAAHRQVWSR